MCIQRSWSNRGNKVASTSEPQEEEVVHTRTDDARKMRQEQHPWLQWLGATSQEVIQYNNVLAEIQDKAFSVPKLPVWQDLIELRLDDVLGSMFTTRVVIGNGYVFVHPFRYAMDIDEVCHRE